MNETRLSAGVIIVRDIEQEPRFLLLRAYQYWDFPKGLVEPGEDPLTGAIREVEEETTLNGLVFAWGEDYRETRPYGPMNKIARYYMARSDHGEVFLPVSEELGHPEHEEFLWVDYHGAVQRVSERVLPIFEWACGVMRGRG